jgi:hypothetical protein
MILFILVLVIAGPLGLLAGLFSLAWMWEYLSGCFFSFSNFCGQDKILKGMLFGAIAIGCFASIKKMWDRTR